MNKPREDLIGKRFGRLVALKISGSIRQSTVWLCKCDCGQKKKIRRDVLLRGETHSCGCLGIERSTTHGMSRSPEYGIYTGMLRRCYNKNFKDYAIYGGRGIVVSDSWLEDFQNFYDDMGPRPSKNHSLDRRDNDGNYCKENCRWATTTEQSNNTSRNHFLAFNGLTMSIAQWAKHLNISVKTLTSRVLRKWPTEKILGTSIRKRVSA